MNGRTASPVSDTAVDCDYYVNAWSWSERAFDDGVEVGAATSWFRFFPIIKGGYSAGSGYYYVIKFPEDFVPNHREATPFAHTNTGYHS